MGGVGWGGVVQLITLSTPTRVEVELGSGCGWAVTTKSVGCDIIVNLPSLSPFEKIKNQMINSLNTSP